MRIYVSFAILIFLLIAGCTTPLHVENNLKFNELNKKIPLNMLLVVDNDNLQPFVIKNYDPISNRTVIFGNSFHNNVRNALSSIFEDVSESSSKKDYDEGMFDAKILVSIDAKNSKGYQVMEAPIQIPAKQMWVEVSLKGRITDNENVVLWSTDVTGKFDKYKPMIKMVRKDYAISDKDTDIKEPGKWSDYYTPKYLILDESNPVVKKKLDESNSVVKKILDESNPVARATVQKGVADAKYATAMALKNALIELQIKILEHRKEITKKVYESSN